MGRGQGIGGEARDEREDATPVWEEGSPSVAAATALEEVPAGRPLPLARRPSSVPLGLKVDAGPAALEVVFVVVGPDIHLAEEPAAVRAESLRPEDGPTRVSVAVGLGAGAGVADEVEVEHGRPRLAAAESHVAGEPPEGDGRVAVVERVQDAERSEVAEERQEPKRREELPQEGRPVGARGPRGTPLWRVVVVAETIRFGRVRTVFTRRPMERVKVTVE